MEETEFLSFEWLELAVLCFGPSVFCETGTMPLVRQKTICKFYPVYFILVKGEEQIVLVLVHGNDIHKDL